VDSTFKKIDYEKFIAVYTGRDKPSARVHRWILSVCTDLCKYSYFDCIRNHIFNLVYGHSRATSLYSLQ